MPAPARLPRSDHCDGRRFYNPHHHVNRSWAEVLRWKLTTRAAPFGLLGPRRAHAPGLDFDALPPIDVVLLSHDHYDHCDLATLRRLAARAPAPPRVIAPLGHTALLRRAGFNS